MSYEDDQDAIVDSAREVYSLQRRVVDLEVQIGEFKQAMFDAGVLTGELHNEIADLQARIARGMAVPLAISASKSFRLPYNKGIQAVQDQLKDDS